MMEKIFEREVLMKVVFLVLISLVCLQGFAEEKTCTLNGMECSSCAGKVKEMVCNPSYSTCEVNVLNKAKKVGQIHLVTKDVAAKVDEKAIGELIKDTTYSIGKCKSGAPAADAKKSS